MTFDFWVQNYRKTITAVQKPQTQTVSKIYTDTFLVFLLDFIVNAATEDFFVI